MAITSCDHDSYIVVHSTISCPVCGMETELKDSQDQTFMLEGQNEELQKSNDTLNFENERQQEEIMELLE